MLMKEYEDRFIKDLISYINTGNITGKGIEIFRGCVNYYRGESNSVLMVYVFGERIVADNWDFKGVRFFLRHKYESFVMDMYNLIDKYGDTLCWLIKKNIIALNWLDPAVGQKGWRIEQTRYYLTNETKPCSDYIFARAVGGPLDAIEWYIKALVDELDKGRVEIFDAIAQAYNYQVAIKWYGCTVHIKDGGGYIIKKQNNEIYKGDTGILSLDGDIEVSSCDEFCTMLEFMRG